MAQRRRRRRRVRRQRVDEAELKQNERDQDDDYVPSGNESNPQDEAPPPSPPPPPEEKEAAQAEAPAAEAPEVVVPEAENQRRRRRGQPLPNEYIPDAVIYQRAWQRNTTKLGQIFTRTCNQNKQFGVMLFFDGRKIGVDNGAEIHFSPPFHLRCNADMVHPFISDLYIIMFIVTQC